MDDGGRLIERWVELAGENPDLARAEVIAAAEALGGRSTRSATWTDKSLQSVEMPTEDSGVQLVHRLALARRVMAKLVPERPGRFAETFRDSAPAHSVSVRWLMGAAGTPGPEELDKVAREWQAAGGSIDLDEPDVRLWLYRSADGGLVCFREVGEVDRQQYERRRTPRLPFRRPVSLDPRLARAAVNLGRVQSGDRVLDPFLGTGSLAIEAALLGARVTGIDIDSTMVRGALRNFSALGLHPESITQGDAAAALGPEVGRIWDALVTDPPYGRASTSVGEDPSALLGRALGRLEGAIRPGGRIVVVMPGGPDPLGASWRRVGSYPDRVHRSLTREFRVFERAGHSTVNVND